MSAATIIGLLLGLATVVELKRIAEALKSLEALARHAEHADAAIARELAALDRIENATGQGRR